MIPSGCRAGDGNPGARVAQAPWNKADTSLAPRPQKGEIPSTRDPGCAVADRHPPPGFKRNGFTPAMYRQLAQAYTRLEDDPALRVGVLYAVGGHFTAGPGSAVRAADAARRKPRARGRHRPHRHRQAWRRRASKPMVVAVRGIHLPLGIELMLAADIVVAADDCRFSQLEVRRGIMATGGAAPANARAWAMPCCTC